MATKFTLQPKPTFKANVSIPRAGDEDGLLTFTFNHKPLKELADLEKLEGKTATDFLMEIISGWALPDTFNAENLSLLLESLSRRFWPRPPLRRTWSMHRLPGRPMRRLSIRDQSRQLKRKTSPRPTASLVSASSIWITVSGISKAAIRAVPASR